MNDEELVVLALCIWAILFDVALLKLLEVITR